MINISRRKIRTWIKKIVERTLGAKLYSKPPFGTDVFDAVRDLRSWSPKDVIFDVGANDGRSVRSLLRYFPNSSIYAFEPVSTTFQKLSTSTAYLENVNCFSYALGAEYQEKTINLHKKPSLSSFSPEWSDFDGKEKVMIDTVDQVMKREEVDFIHFLKIDTEGHEMAVLRGAQQALSSARIGIIQVEAGLDKSISPHTSFELIRQYLAPMGYYPHGIFHQKRRRLATPDNWDSDDADKYRPSAIKYFDALFMVGSTTDIRTSA